MTEDKENSIVLPAKFKFFVGCINDKQSLGTRRIGPFGRFDYPWAEGLLGRQLSQAAPEQALTLRAVYFRSCWGCGPGTYPISRTSISGPVGLSFDIKYWPMRS